MFHSSQVAVIETLHGVCPSADRDPRMRQTPLHENSANAASGDMSDVFYLDQERYDHQMRVAALHRLNTVTVEFDSTLDGLMRQKQFEVGCEPGNGEAQVAFSSDTYSNDTGTIRRIEMHWDNDSPERLQTKGAERIISHDELYPNRDDETRLRRVTAYLLMQDGLGHVKKFPTGTRFHYDAYVADLEAQGVDYIKFTDGFHPCVMTGTSKSFSETSQQQQGIALHVDATQQTETVTRKAA